MTESLPPSMDSAPTSALPIAVADLLYFRGVEAARVELKSSWNEGPTAQQVLATICAFANDFYNVNGGYIVLGVEERDGVAQLPPRGLDPGELERIQRWIRGNCNRLEPVYQPTSRWSCLPIRRAWRRRQAVDCTGVHS